jgi:AmmeMemoRadiSam system protein B
MQPRVREAAVAGSWYPGDRAALATLIDGYLKEPPPADLRGRLVALVSPHAGLRYSGPVAAFAYAHLRGLRDQTVVLVGPSHRVPFAGASVWPRGAFRTPLGDVPIDEELADELLAADPVMTDWPAPHRDEHSLEMQLPFLQHVVAGLRIVPVLLGSQTRAETMAVAKALSTALAGSDALLVASTDLSHYQPAPVANALDALVVARVEALDPNGLMARLEADPGHACGGGPLVAVMKAAQSKGANAARVLRYADSGDAGEHDKSRVVGYLAAALVEAR